jgi:hypothetical protein
MRAKQRVSAMPAQRKCPDLLLRRDASDSFTPRRQRLSQQTAARSLTPA